MLISVWWSAYMMTLHRMLRFPMHSNQDIGPNTNNHQLSCRLSWKCDTFVSSTTVQPWGSGGSTSKIYLWGQDNSTYKWQQNNLSGSTWTCGIAYASSRKSGPRLLHPLLKYIMKMWCFSQCSRWVLGLLYFTHQGSFAQLAINAWHISTKREDKSKLFWLYNSSVDSSSD